MGELFKIFIAFLIPGVVGFGGGPASIAIINSTVVDMFGLLSQSDMDMIISFSNALPGPIATLLALGVGFYSSGIIGGIVALIGIMFPSCVMIIISYKFLMKHKEDYRVKRISKFILPLIIVLFFQISVNFLTQSFVSLGDTVKTLFLIFILVICSYFVFSALIQWLYVMYTFALVILSYYYFLISLYVLVYVFEHQFIPAS